MECVEVDVACEDVGYGGPDDEPYTRCANVCGVDYSWIGNYQGGVAVRDVASSLHRHGRGEYCVCGNAGRGCSVFCEIEHALPPGPVAGNISVRGSGLACQLGGDGAHPPSGG